MTLQEGPHDEALRLSLDKCPAVVRNSFVLQDSLPYLHERRDVPLSSLSGLLSRVMSA